MTQHKKLKRKIEANLVYEQKEHFSIDGDSPLERQQSAVFVIIIEHENHFKCASENLIAISLQSQEKTIEKTVFPLNADFSHSCTLTRKLHLSLFLLQVFFFVSSTEKEHIRMILLLRISIRPIGISIVVPFDYSFLELDSNLSLSFSLYVANAMEYSFQIPQNQIEIG